MEKLWLIKDKKGHIFGPHNEKEVCFYIEEGEFKGEELVSKYPAGKWQALSTHPVFYEKLLSVINKSNDPDSSQTDISKNEKESLTKEPIEATRIIEHPSSSKKEKVKIKLSKEFKKEILDEEKEYQDIIEMENVDEQFFKRLKETINIPIVIFIAVIGVLSFSYFFSSDNKTIKKTESVRLLAPMQKKTSLSQKEIDEKIKSALLFYTKSTVSNYLKAQTLYTQVLSAQPETAPLYMYLCLVHLELWPFSHQDTIDKQALKTTLSLAQKFDKSNHYADLCKSVKALIDKKFEQVLMITNRLTLSNTEINPIFIYYLKAKALNSLNKNKEALSYLQSIFVLKAQWIAPYLFKADILYRNSDYDLAGQTYQKILRIFKDHPSAKLRLGILEYKYFKKPANSEKNLRSVLDKLNDWIEPDILFSAYITIANIYLKKNEKKLAIKYSTKAYALDPRHPEMLKIEKELKDETNFENTRIKAKGLIYKGDFLVNQGNCAQAKIEFEKAYEVTRSGLAALKLAECYWQMKASGSAIRWLKRAINSDSQLLSAYFLLSDYYSSLYEFESAKEVLKSVKKISPSNSDLFKAYALLAFRQRHYKSTVAYAKRALKFYTFDIDIYILLSQAHKKLGQDAKAYYYGKKAIEEDVNNIQAQITYALTLDSANEEYDIEGYLKELVKNFPAIVEYKQALGEYYFNEDEYEKAQAEFENIISQHSKYKSAYTYLGRVHSALSLKETNKQEHKEIALKYFIEASLLDVSDPDPIFYAGKTHLNHEEYQAAENEFKKILQINPNYPMIHYYIGLTLFNQNKKEEALKFSKTQSVKTPNHYLPYKLIGDIYKSISGEVFDTPQEKKNSYELCAKFYQKALKHFKKDIETSLGLLECYKSAGNLDLALQLGRQLTEDTKLGLSGYPDIYKEIGSILEKKEEYEKARVKYLEYFKLNPGAKDRMEIDTRINKLIKEKNSLTKETAE